MPYRRREERESERIRTAAARAAIGATMGTAMDAALLQIGAAFDEAAALNDFKLRVERLLRLGPQHAAVRARFRARTERLHDAGLDAAIARVERWWRDERKAFQVASALGYGNRLSLEVLRELRLALRLMRFKRMQAEFGAIAAAVCDDALALAAE
jgi:hypothetical protein